MSQMQFLSREGLPDLAYYSCPGRAPGVVYIPGYGSDMNTPKCLALEEYCAKTGHAFLRFDYRGCGNSGGDFDSSLIGDWKNDVMAVLDQLTSGPQVLVGSSFGGWLMYLAALDRPQRIVGLVGIGTAPDAFINFFARQPEEVKAEAARKGFYNHPTGISGTMHYRLTYKFLHEAEQHSILKRPIPITCPVRMLHGLDDDTVPWKRALQAAELLGSKDVSVILRTQGGHLLQDTASLRQLVDVVDNLMKSLTTDGNSFCSIKADLGKL